MAPQEVGQEFWDERYGGAQVLWSGRPNHFLVTEIGRATPGRALDVGCGEGADTIWLAERGWTVTGTDISTVALDRARRLTGRLSSGIAMRITWLHADITQWDPPSQSFDLVSAQYFQGPPEMRDALWPKLIGAIAPGGTLLVVAHDPEDPHVREHHHSGPERFYKGTEIAERLAADGWVVSKNSSENRTREGDDTEFLDVVFRATRRSPTP
jgi:SAM-dependent methyltransferase